MRMPARVFLLLSLLPASLSLGLASGAGAQTMPGNMKMDAAAAAPSAPVKQTRWSDPASWPGGKVPRRATL